MRSWVLEVIDDLADYFGKEPSAAVVATWLQELDEYHRMPLLRAVEECKQIHKYPTFPMLAEFLPLVRKQVPPNNKGMVWSRAMATFGANLRGEITDTELDNDPNWRWCVQRGVLGVPEEMGIISDDEPVVLQGQ